MNILNTYTIILKIEILNFKWTYLISNIFCNIITIMIPEIINYV